MERRRTFPWPGAALAAVGAIALFAFSGELWLSVAILLLWLGSLWLAAAEPPPQPQKRRNGGFSRDTMGELIEHSGTPLLLTERGRIAIANEAAREVLGAHIVGQDVRVALRHPEAIALIERDTASSALIKGLATRRDIWRMSRQPLDEQFAVIELINRTAEADISRAHTDFVANASHELRTPLASIIGYVETLSEEDDVDRDTRKRFLDTILREARRLQGLVHDLMSLSRVEAEKHDLPGTFVEFADLVQRATRDAAGDERIGRIELRLDPVKVRGDEHQLEQLVRNLVDNALKYGAEDEVVRVRLMTDERGALLTVADTGEGIAAEHLPHLTRRFYRTDPGRSRASGGTGLGLAIVKHIVERHRGRLDIASLPGLGTTVTVRLPAVPTDPSRESR
jgi:two-component system, OmpR family, phosphate regulon sensor histidine kinase PhoR